MLYPLYFGTVSIKLLFYSQFSQFILHSLARLGIQTWTDFEYLILVHTDVIVLNTIYVEYQRKNFIM